MLSEKARAARNAYRREYYRTHKEKQKEQNEKYWERKALELEQTAETEGDSQ